MGKKAISNAGAREVGRLLFVLRNSQFPRADYDRVAGMFRALYFAPAERYRIGKRHNWPDQAAAVTLLASAGLDLPSAQGPAAFEQMVANFAAKASARGFLEYLPPRIAGGFPRAPSGARVGIVRCVRAEKGH